MITRSGARGPVPGWFVPLVAVLALVIATAALTVALLGRDLAGFGAVGPGMMRGAGAIGGRGMMGATRAYPQNGPEPGESGFVAGTGAAPRTIRVYAGPGYAFTPSSIRVARGETVTFVVTTMGPLIHEFMVGPADDVAADTEGTREIADIGMMETKSLTYSFDAPGAYAYACHVDGHYEAGMSGTIEIVG